METVRDAKHPGSGAVGRRRLYYGWVMTGIAALGIFLSGPGQTYSVSIFIDPLVAEFGWSRSLVSSLYSGGTLAAGLLMTLIGRLVDARGYRTMLTAVALCFAAALFFMSTITAPLALFVGFMAIRTFGQGSLTLIPFSMVPQWFITRRGRALAILAAAAGISSAVLPYVNLAVIESWGWRSAWQVWSLVLAAVLAPVAWLWVKERPEDLGLGPDGIPLGEEPAGRTEGRGKHAATPVALAATELPAPGPGRSGATPGAPAARSGSARSGGRAVSDPELAFTLKEAMATREFWVLLGVTSIPSMVGTGALFHHMSIMAENRVESGLAASVFTVAAVTTLLFTAVAGYAADRYPVRWVLAGTLVGQALSLLVLLNAGSPTMVLLLGLTRGTVGAFFQVLSGVVWPHFFGRRHLAGIRGVTTTAMVIASALGPLPFGVAYDVFGGYVQVLSAMALLPAAGAVVVYLLLRPAAEFHRSAAAPSPSSR